MGKKTALSGVEKRIRIYAGQYYDQETGLHYNYWRYYDPKLGRYLRADPIGLKGGINLFTYVFNNPEGQTDPSGQFAIVDDIIFWGLVGVTAIVVGNYLHNPPKIPAPHYWPDNAEDSDYCKEEWEDAKNICDSCEVVSKYRSYDDCLDAHVSEMCKGGKVKW